MDELVKLNKRLGNVVKAFNDLKKCGMDEEILVIYLKDKTKLSKKNIELMLKHTEEFYKKLRDDAFLKSLEVEE